MNIVRKQELENRAHWERISGHQEGGYSEIRGAGGGNLAFVKRRGVSRSRRARMRVDSGMCSRCL